MPTKQTTLTTTFLITSAISAIFLIASTSNYTQFYRAIEGLDLTMLEVGPSIGENSVSIALVFSITNPTSYVGLRLRELSCALYFEANGKQIDLWWHTITYYEQPLSISSYWNKTFDYQIDLDVDDESTTLFTEFYKAHQGNIKWRLNGSVILISFVGKIDVPLTAQFLSHL